MSGSDNNRGKNRPLSEEEADLWARIADTAEPLDPKQKNRSRSVTATETSAGHRAKKLQHISRSKPQAPVAKKSQDKKATPPLAKFDQKKAKKISKGQEDIEARIDLHGMRQAEAHGALRSFLFRCHGNEKRNVLVITGKGGTKRNNPDDNSAWFDYEEPGVLRRALPNWLSEPDLRAIVVSFTEAHVRHGGSGAFYVRLRKLGK